MALASVSATAVSERRLRGRRGAARGVERTRDVNDRARRADVTGTTIVQLPGLSVVPVATVMAVAVVLTPAHALVLAPEIVTPAGIVSVNGEVSVIAPGFGLPSARRGVAAADGDARRRSRLHSERLGV